MKPRRIFSVVAKETAPPPAPVDEIAELRALIEQVRAKAAAFIDRRASELAASPACISGADSSCPCPGALRVFLGDERDQEIKARQKKDGIR